MPAASAPIRDEFTWEVQPAASLWVARTVTALEERNPPISRLRHVLHDETGTRLVDWVDHLALAEKSSSNGAPRLADELTEIGYVRQSESDADASVWRHPLGMFPPVLVDGGREGMAIRVDSVDDALEHLPRFLNLASPQVTDAVGIASQSGGPYRQTLLAEENGVALWLTERHGWPGFQPPKVDRAQIDAAKKHLNVFLHRQRAHATVEQAFQHTSQLVTAAAAEIGTAWTCDLFYYGEREYWQSRNHAARVQYERQNRLGLGWANHDHHTYRSSRRSFHQLITVLEQMGFQCRERFYAGREAGWGAQVLEQPDCRIVIFADVDLSPDEVLCDFAHEPLADRDALGTVGVWCELQGEAFFEAGMHHLECQFDFDAARAQLAELGIETLAPFTNFPYLRQAFTKGEIWQVDPARVDRLLKAGRITAEHAERFLRDGVLGSHLEILERNDGYKGFNQTGISDIITRTDPRRVIGA
ncbi:MAG: hypothetical protein WD669_05205 [Pirellulales bacterium]